MAVRGTGLFQRWLRERKDLLRNYEAVLADMKSRDAFNTQIIEDKVEDLKDQIRLAEKPVVVDESPKTRGYTDSATQTTPDSIEVDR